jgi:hypothetical protein
MYNSTATRTLGSAWMDFDCKLTGTVIAPGDTTWAQLYLATGNGGILGATITVDDCEQDLGCDDEDGGEAGGGGGGQGSSTCYYIVAADANGNPLTDEAGDYYVLEDLGCS